MRNSAGTLAVIYLLAAIVFSVDCLAAATPPVKLKSSSNLCAEPGANDVLTIPAQLAIDGAPSGGVSGLLSRAEKNKDEYFSRLDGMTPFSGLYFRGEMDQPASNGGNRNALAMEWELFRQGWDDSRKRLAKTRLEKKAQYYQALREMEEGQLDEERVRLEQIRNNVLFFVHERMVSELKPLLERRRQAMVSGFATREEVADLEFKLERATEKKAYYQAANRLTLSVRERDLINRIESISLRPQKDLIERAVAFSYEHKLQELFAIRSEFFPTWSDDLSVRLYVEQNREVERRAQTVFGVRTRVPIGTDKGRKELVAFERNLYLEQQEAVKLRLAEKITMLREKLHARQSEFRLLSDEHQLLRTKTELSCYRVSRPVSKLAGSPERRLDELVIERLEKEKDILLARLDVLAILVELTAVVKPEKPEGLYLLR